jgi:hypothetical protein
MLINTLVASAREKTEQHVIVMKVKIIVIFKDCLTKNHVKEFFILF